MYRKSGGVSVESKVKCTEKKSKRGMYKKENRQRRWKRTCTERKVGHVRKGRWRELGIYGKEDGHDVRKGRRRGCIVLKETWRGVFTERRVRKGDRAYTFKVDKGTTEGKRNIFCTF